jgi:hypothetical protein
MGHHLKVKEMKSKYPPICSYLNCAEFLKPFLEHEKTIYYKSCHYCFTFYCSRECRKLDWINHTNLRCLTGRLSSLCKKILIKISRNSDLRCYLTKIVNSSYINFNKEGFIWLNFKNSNCARNFLDVNLTNNSKFFIFSDLIQPKYVFFDSKNYAKDLFDESKDFQDIYIIKQIFSHCSNKISSVDEEFKAFCDLFNTYIPQKEFIMLVSIEVNEDNDTLPKQNDTLKQSNINNHSKYVLKFIKIPFSPKVTKELSLNHSDTNNNPFLMLTSFKKLEKIDNIYNNKIQSTEKSRQLFLANLLNEFEMRKINIRITYPDIYKNLCLYVNQNKPFTPVCLFPRDLNKNDIFMCLIMPNSEPIKYIMIKEKKKEICQNE